MVFWTGVLRLICTTGGTGGVGVGLAVVVTGVIRVVVVEVQGRKAALMVVSNEQH